MRDEAEAKTLSDGIDRSIAVERENRKRRKGIKILLLGQAESGKSTILKNFQIHFAPKAFGAEAESWRPIIQLNLVRSVNFILNFLTTGTPGRSEPSSPSKLLSGELCRLALSLAPLREIEMSLVESIPGSVSSTLSRSPTYNPAKASEVAVTSGLGWKTFLTRLRSGEEEAGAQRREKENDGNTRILMACAEDMRRLWNEPFVQNSLEEQGISLRDQSGFFLDDVMRICRKDYIPTSNDILRARVQTLGPQEHHITLENPSEQTRLWTIYDVGGSRSQRAVWAQFFDDVNVIIFLAPLSGFDQMLEEDETVNRLTDSLRLWQMISRNRILQSVELILFLNKLDILDAKLKSGIQFRQHEVSYSGVNNTKSVAKFMVDTFFSLHQQSARKRRNVYPHLVCAIDITATAKIIDRVYHVVVVKYLSNNNIL